LSDMKIIKEFIGVLLSRSGSGVLLSGTGVLLSSGIFNNILKMSSYVFGVLMSLECYCRIQRNFKTLFEIFGFYFLLSVEFFCLLSSTVSRGYQVTLLR
jgi:hypothetical protein